MKKGLLIKIFTYVALACCVLSLVGAVVCLSVGSRLSSYKTGIINEETDLAAFASDTLYAAGKGSRTLRATISGKDDSVEMDSEIVALYSSGGIVAACLQSRDVVLFDEDFERLGTVSLGYPADWFAYSERHRKMAFTASTSSTRNYIFVYENTTAESVGERRNASSAVKSVGIGISEVDGNVYVASYNSAIYRLEPAGAGKMDTVEVFKDGQSMFTLYVGKEGPGGKGDYVRSSLTASLSR